MASPNVRGGPPSRGPLAYGGITRVAFREAIGLPAVVLGGSYIGFGALVRESGFELWVTVASTVFMWALPGQVALIELYKSNTALAALLLAVGLTNLRMLPMTVALFPLLRTPGRPIWVYFAAAQLVAVTGWVVTMRRSPDLAPRERLPYFVVFTGTLMVLCVICGSAGYLMSARLPAPVTLGLVFLNPIYFLLMFATDLSHAGRLIALVLGGAAAPVMHAVSPDWGLVVVGLGAGTVGHWLGRHLQRRRAQV